MMSELNRNQLAFLIVTACIAAGAGAVWYFVFGWPVFTFPLWEPFAAAGGTVGVGSPWHIVGWREIIIATALVTAAGIAQVTRARGGSVVLAVAIGWLLSLNARVFPLGYGYDIFVHDATVRAWIEYGAIAPRSFLYAGYYAIISALAPLLSLRPIVVMSWFVPIMGALIIAASVRQEKKSWPTLVAVGILFPALFTTATPQALGHLLLLGYAMLTWQRTLPWYTQVLIVAGISIIHPLSGIPALALSLGTLTHRLGIVLVPATLLLLFSPTKTFFALPQIFLSDKVFFNPFIIHQLLQYWIVLAMIIFISATLFGWWTFKNNNAVRERMISALAVVASGVPLLFITTRDVIAYEQNAFALRLFLAGALIATPITARGITALWERTKQLRTTGVGWFISCVVLIMASWYNAHEPWNTAARTSGRVVTPTDFNIVRAIDADAGGIPYIVLADQISSAAALHEFGFTKRRLQARPEFFYPIPTGGTLYTDFFLPSMYNGITRERLVGAAAFAGVKRVYIILKPYWITTATQKNTLKQNTSRSFEVEGVLVGRFDTPSQT